MKKVIIMLMSIVVLLAGCASNSTHEEKTKLSLCGVWESDTSIYVHETNDSLLIHNRLEIDDSIVIWHQKLLSRVLDSEYADTVNYHVVGDSILLFNYQDETKSWRITPLSDTTFTARGSDFKITFRKL